MTIFKLLNKSMFICLAKRFELKLQNNIISEVSNLIMTP